jgi:hypothetical protein
MIDFNVVWRRMTVPLCEGFHERSSGRTQHHGERASRPVLPKNYRLFPRIRENRRQGKEWWIKASEAREIETTLHRDQPNFTVINPTHVFVEGFLPGELKDFKALYFN